MTKMQSTVHPYAFFVLWVCWSVGVLLYKQYPDKCTPFGMGPTQALYIETQKTAGALYPYLRCAPSSPCLS